ncbi:response regulator [Alkalibacillus haloalkaliphilus]|uniref:response regulator n=1 Tax=Alkalibacillus haloalkaliphilus TaxID=94136 RepID=UPI0029362E49|nr:response regulator [Alkalibacillus haloalkaliphilus]MDV2582026.1 response regulator [Alkalibacillus haloalkaliphilus]
MLPILTKGEVIINKVFLIDDSYFIRKWIKSILHKSKRYEVVAEGSDGADALNLYLIHQPDIVIMDIVMKQLNGIDALKNIIDNNPEAKVIMCTSMGQEHLWREAKNSGAKGYILKPNFNTLITNLDDILNK